MAEEQRLSVPEYVRVPPRALTDRERAGMLAVADALVPESPAGPRPSQAADFLPWLDRALAARRDAFESVTSLAGELADVPEDRLLDELKRRSDEGDGAFVLLSGVLAGAYLLMPEVRRAIGYPGQAQRPPRFDEAAEQIMDGILDPVIERGPVYRPTEPAGDIQGGQ